MRLFFPDDRIAPQQKTGFALVKGSERFSHVPPMHDDFDPALNEEYISLIREAKNTILSANGHNHVFDLYQPFHDGIWYLTTGSPSTRIFSYVTIYPYATTGKKFNCVNVAF